MPRLTQPEFAEKCGIGLNYLSVNKKRGKVITDEHGFIDDTNEINQLFMQKCLSRTKKEPKTRIDSKESTKPLIKQSKPQPEKPENDEFSRENTLTEIQREK